MTCALFWHTCPPTYAAKGICSIGSIQVNRDWSCTWGMIQTKIHLIITACPWPSIALQCRIWPKTPFIHFTLLLTLPWVLLIIPVLLFDRGVKPQARHPVTWSGGLFSCPFVALPAVTINLYNLLHSILVLTRFQALCYWLSKISDHLKCFVNCSLCKPCLSCFDRESFWILW